MLQSFIEIRNWKIFLNRQENWLEGIREDREREREREWKSFDNFVCFPDFLFSSFLIDTKYMENKKNDSLLNLVKSIHYNHYWSSVCLLSPQSMEILY